MRGRGLGYTFSMKRWTQVFKALANTSRLRIIKLLSDGEERTVSEIAKEIHVSFKGTSRHLLVLYNREILNNDGKAGHVFYSMNPKMPADAKHAVELFLKSSTG